MRISKRDNGYTMWLSARDTYAWANKEGAVWPCSRLAGHRLAVVVNRNGLFELISDGHQTGSVNESELIAIVTDHLPKGLRHLWPSYEAEAA